MAQLLGRKKGRTAMSSISVVCSKCGRPLGATGPASPAPPLCDRCGPAKARSSSPAAAGKLDASLDRLFQDELRNARSAPRRIVLRSPARRWNFVPLFVGAAALITSAIVGLLIYLFIRPETGTEEVPARVTANRESLRASGPERRGGAAAASVAASSSSSPLATRLEVRPVPSLAGGFGPFGKFRDVADFRGQLRRYADDYRRLVPVEPSEPLRWLRFEANVRRRNIDAVRFTVAEEPVDVVWAFTADAGLLAWGVIPVESSELAQGDRYTQAERADWPGLSVHESLRVAVQGAAGLRLAPGHDYLLWFQFQDDRRRPMAAAMRYVPAGSFDENSTDIVKLLRDGVPPAAVDAK